MTIFYQLFFVVFIVFFQSSLSVTTVRRVSVDQYAGRWHQVYTNGWADSFSDIEGAECTTATYTKVNETFVTVFNAYKTLNGVSDSIGGYAYIPDTSEPGKLIVYLDGVLLPAPYWIFKLGPVVDGLYDYSLVSDTASLSLFVLARDPIRFDDLYEEEVLEYLRLQRFVGPLRGPVKVLHDENCEYPPFPL